MIIDCDSCEVAGLACSDCVVSVLLGGEGEATELDTAEERAIGVLAEAGLVPPLRLVVGQRPEPPRDTPIDHLPPTGSAG